MARVASPGNTIASLFLGAYQVARDRIARGGEFLNLEPLVIVRHLEEIKASEGPRFLVIAKEALPVNLQGHAASSSHHCCELGHDPVAAFALLRALR